MDHILLYPIAPDFTDIAWLEYDKTGQPIGTIAHSTLALFAEHLQAKAAVHVPITLVIPGQYVSLLTITLPLGNANHIRQALPYLLEEQLADEIENCHIALPTVYTPGETTTVAVIQKDLFNHLLANCEALDLNLQCCVPDMLLLPLYSDGWTVLLTGETQASDENNVAEARMTKGMAHIRQGATQGFAIERDQYLTLLKLALSKIHIDEQPQKIHFFWKETESDQIPQQCTEALGIEVLEHPYTLTPPFSIFLSGAAAEIQMNLLQAEYAPKRAIATNKIPDRWIGYLALLFIFTIVVNLGFEYRALNQRYHDTHDQLFDLYKQVFPNATQINRPRELLQRELDNRLGGGENAKFYQTLLILNQSLIQHTAIQITKLTYQKEQITLALSAPDFTQLEKWNQFLENKHLIVKQERADKVLDHVEAQFSIE